MKVELQAELKVVELVVVLVDVLVVVLVVVKVVKKVELMELLLVVMKENLLVVKKVEMKEQMWVEMKVRLWVDLQVEITPACAFVTPWTAVLIGLIAGIFCSLAVGLKYKFNYDDSLDVVGVHLVGGLWCCLSVS